MRYANHYANLCQFTVLCYLYRQLKQLLSLASIPVKLEGNMDSLLLSHEVCPSDFVQDV